MEGLIQSADSGWVQAGADELREVLELTRTRHSTTKPNYRCLRYPPKMSAKALKNPDPKRKMLELLLGSFSLWEGLREKATW